mgnify:FL=1
MSYNVTPQEIYEQCKGYGTPHMNARGWVETENLWDTYAVIIKWFRLMERDEANNRYSDPRWQTPAGRPPLTQKLADQIIVEIDKDYEIEQSRFPSSGLGPEFARLAPHARLTFVQELYGVMKSDAELDAACEARLAAGEQLPPEFDKEGYPLDWPNHKAV